MLVAAGLGTRLDPLTRELPKPALPVANQPIAWFSCDHLARSGFTEVVVNTHHLAERLQPELERVCPPGMHLRFVHEPQILGTGGGLRNAWRPIDGEAFVVVNAKLVFAPDLARAIAVHQQTQAIATMVLRPLPQGSSFSPVEIEADGTVRTIRGGPSRGRGGLARRMFTGVQILSARAWADLPEQGDLIEHAYLPWLARGELVASVTDDSPWIDVGVTPRHYLEANLAIATGGLRWPGITPTGSNLILGADSRIGPGSHLEQVVLGDGAEVKAGATLSRVVAWRGAKVPGDLTNAVITTSGAILQL